MTPDDHSYMVVSSGLTISEKGPSLLNGSFLSSGRQHKLRRNISLG